MNSKLSGFFFTLFDSTFDGSLLLNGFPIVGISSMLEIVILLVSSSSEWKDSSVKDKSAKTFLFVVHRLALS